MRVCPPSQAAAAGLPPMASHRANRHRLQKGTSTPVRGPLGWMMMMTVRRMKMRMDRQSVHVSGRSPKLLSGPPWKTSRSTCCLRSVRSSIRTELVQISTTSRKPLNSGSPPLDVCGTLVGGGSRGISIEWKSRPQRNERVQRMRDIQGNQVMRCALTCPGSFVNTSFIPTLKL